MTETLTMSTKERQRLQVMNQLSQGKLTIVRAAASLGVSERQMYRILGRYRKHGDRGLVHGLRGRSSNRQYPESVRREALLLYQQTYADYGPTLFAEMLSEYHHQTVDSDTLRRWLRQAGLWMGLRAARRHRTKRERRDAIGALIQFDGSSHAWFEDRGEPCCLLVAIDDASGRIFMRFAESENAQDVLAMLWLYVKRYGVPREFYVDFGSVYHAKKARLTDVARALSRLGVKLIYARSPQAKGRVERSNRTHQDRLIKAMRRAGISTIDEANSFLDSSYLRDHNARFACCDHLPDVHRSADGLDLKNVFCFETTRCVHNDYTISLDANFIQLEAAQAPLPPPGRYVTLRRWLDGSLHIFWKEQELAFKHLDHAPQPRPRIVRPPAADHPWRRSDIGRKRTKRMTRLQILALHNNPPLLPP